MPDTQRGPEENLTNKHRKISEIKPARKSGKVSFIQLASLCGQIPKR